MNGCVHGNQLTIDGVSKYLPPRLLANKDQKTVVSNIVTLLDRFSVLTREPKVRVWKHITALMTDLASENHHLAERIADHIQSPDIPGMPWCNLPMGKQKQKNKDLTDQQACLLILNGIQNRKSLSSH